MFIQHKPKRIKLDEGAAIATVWARVASKRNQEPLQPMPFELPTNFQHVIQEALDHQSLTGRARAKFITTIAESIYRYKSYHTKSEYEHVENQKWSFLETRSGHVIYLLWPWINKITIYILFMPYFLGVLS